MEPLRRRRSILNNIGLRENFTPYVDGVDIYNKGGFGKTVSDEDVFNRFDNKTYIVTDAECDLLDYDLIKRYKWKF